MERNRVIEQLLVDDILTELSGSTALRMTLSDTDQPLSIVIEEKGRVPEWRRLDGYLDLAVLLSFELAFKKDRYEYVHPDYYAAALRAKSEQDFRDIYYHLKREAWLLDVRDMIVNVVIDFEDTWLVGDKLDIVSNMLYGDFKLASELAFFSTNELVEGSKLFDIDPGVYAQQVFESLVPITKRVIKYKHPAVFTLLGQCSNKFEFKQLCCGDLTFLKSRMDNFSDHEMETVLAMELGL